MSGYAYRTVALKRSHLRAALAAVVLALGSLPATSSAHSPSRLWYRLHITYNGTRHVATTWSIDPSEPCCYLRVTGLFRDEHVRWSASSKGSVLVQLLSQRGVWGIENGVLVGDLKKAKIDDRTRYQTKTLPYPQNTTRIDRCSEETKGDLLRETHFETGQLFIGTFSLVPPVLTSGALEATHTTGDLSSCPPVAGSWPPPYPPDTTTRYSPYPLPFRPSFSGSELKAVTRRTRLALRGPNRFGASRIVLHTLGSYHKGPKVTPVGPAFPGVMTFRASGKEDVTVVLDRCPGTAPC